MLVGEYTLIEYNHFIHLEDRLYSLNDTDFWIISKLAKKLLTMNGNFFPGKH